MKTVSLISSIGKRIKYYRTLHKISLSALAKDAKVSKSTLFGLELGETNPTISTLEAIAKALNIDISELINSQQESKLSLIDNPTHNSSALYQLKLAPFESYSYTSNKSTNLTLEIIDGSLTISDTGIHLNSGQKSHIAADQKLIASSKGATALIKITEENIPPLIAADILPEESKQLSPVAIVQKTLAQKSLRILSKNNKTERIDLSPYISNSQQEFDSLTINYYIARFLGYKAAIKEWAAIGKESQELKATLEFVDKAINNEVIEESYTRTLSQNPLKAYYKTIESLLEKEYKGLTTITLDNILNHEIEKRRPYLLVSELLESTTQAQSDTLTRNLYRAIENMLKIDESLLEEERECYDAINQSLPEILYYAINGYSQLAATLTYKLIATLKPSMESAKIEHNGFKLFYYELFKELQQTIEFYENGYIYMQKSDLENILKDFGATIHLAKLLSPAINSGGKYIYIIEM